MRCTKEVLTQSEFEDLKNQVIKTTLYEIDALSNHCASLDLTNPHHIPVQLTLMLKIRDLENELGELATLTYQKYLSITLT